MIGIFKDFRILGRHLTPILPPLILATSAALGFWHTKYGVKAIFTICFLLVCAFSSFSLRWLSRHRKDDYRGAANLAQIALTNEKKVWWAADSAAAFYYGISISNQGNIPNSAILTLQEDKELLLQRPLPDLVIFSKPDIYDANGNLSHYIKAARLQKKNSLQSFTIWELSP